MKAILGIGTNIGDRLDNIRSAVNALGRLPGTTVIKLSSVYETKPWGYTMQDNFYNVCVLVETSLSAHALLGACLGIEAAVGRVRTFKNAPRVLDIDLLLYENAEISSEELTVPHPFIRQRTFVLVPLHDITENDSFFSYDFSADYAACDKSEIISVHPSSTLLVDAH